MKIWYSSTHATHSTGIPFSITLQPNLQLCSFYLSLAAEAKHINWNVTIHSFLIISSCKHLSNDEWHEKIKKLTIFTLKILYMILVLYCYSYLFHKLFSRHFNTCTRTLILITLLKASRPISDAIYYPNMRKEQLLTTINNGLELMDWYFVT